ncbi:maleylpyruvate isomerase family mycothiol-dependent enzyme [Phytoactinopolyspora limicola]|uniref:maleylpyruvate isomerase family mycothiol-dependent enzyme n=1 Tax=Phytoactinopolyspora limicola TaxID=2715536 RepID=UPI001FE79C71|nr:maleylpyruvate isomerase family mycothiol-dependent enzyme [Phytoactinopolyspora limicola]
MSSKNADNDAVESAGPVSAATERLVTTASAFDAEALAAPSLCAGWTRGHVLAHLARNADALTNLLTWARTGVRTPMYPSREEREADINTGAAASPEALLTDLQEASARFTAAVTDLPADRWQREVVTGPAASGRTIPVRRTLWMRLQELEVHHVDLDAGYTVEHWPDMFVGRALTETVRSFSQRDDTPAFVLVTNGFTTRIGTGGQVTVSGDSRSVLAWLMGRSPGTGLSTEPNRPLPELPAWL